MSVCVMVNHSDIPGLGFLRGVQKRRPGKRVFLPGEQFILHAFSGSFSSEGVDVLASGLNRSRALCRAMAGKTPPGSWVVVSLPWEALAKSGGWGSPAFCTKAPLSPELSSSEQHTRSKSFHDLSQKAERLRM